MRSAKEYRAIAKENVASYTKVLVVIALIATVIAAIINFTVYEEVVIDGVTVMQGKKPLSFLGIFVSAHIAMGWVIVSKSVYNREEVKIGTLFQGFNNYGKVFVANILQAIYLVLWGIITLGVMTIVKSFSYSMTYYVMADNPSLSANEAITESRRIMKGHKWKLFCLMLSYIGWILLSILTFGILLLWIEPKMQQAQYVFYKDCLEDIQA